MAGRAAHALTAGNEGDAEAAPLLIEGEPAGTEGVGRLRL